MDSDDWITGRVTLRIGTQPVEVELTVPAKPVQLHRMMPVFQQLTNMFVDASAEVAATEGRTVSCKAGCGACCRQAVPVSEAEVQQIAELVAALPEPRRSAIRERFAAGVARIRAIGWFEAMDACFAAAPSKPPEEARREVTELALQYFHQGGVACPFLEDESCSIHADRPLACREYLVSSPAEDCRTVGAGKVRKIEMAWKLSRPLYAISRTGRFGERFLPLILALELVERYPQALPEKTGPEWMEAFFGELGPEKT